MIKQKRFFDKFASQRYKKFCYLHQLSKEIPLHDEKKAKKVAFHSQKKDNPAGLSFICDNEDVQIISMASP